MRLAADLPGEISSEPGIYESRLVLDGCTIVELGCGAADHTRRIATGGRDRTLIAFDTDDVQLARNRQQDFPPNVSFRSGAAEDIDLPAASADVVLMFKSLHHVPVALMDRALEEIRRVLVPGGVLYVSEPVFAGELNDVIRLFHDEQDVRAAAFAALGRAVERRDFDLVDEIFYRNQVHFADFDEFDRRLISVTHSDHRLSPALLAEVRARFERHLGGDGARFEAPMRVDILRKPQD